MPLGSGATATLKPNEDAMRFGPGFLSFVLAAASVAGCVVSRPFVASGDASTVEIGYGGGLAGVEDLARKHCLGFGKNARLLETQRNLAFYDCVAF